MRYSNDSPQPLLWPQLQVSEGEKSYTCNHFAFHQSNDRPDDWLLPRREAWTGKTLATLTLCRAGKAAD
ncbi:hypothetical protein MJ391_27300 [Escherichia coli]|nr:hypothetical protein MJ391_27300 [Escherichia coli]